MSDDKPAAPTKSDKTIRKRTIADKVSLVCVLLGIVFITLVILMPFIFSSAVSINGPAPSSYTGLGAFFMRLSTTFNLWRTLLFLAGIILFVLGIVVKVIGMVCWKKPKELHTITKRFMGTLAIVLLIIVIATSALTFYAGKYFQPDSFGPCLAPPGYGCLAKPVIYLYPESTLQVQVTVKIPKGRLTTTEPLIGAGNGWNVTSQPNGKIIEDGESYPYLFYEASELWTISINRGWVVQESNVTNWFNTTLPKMGLSTNETRDFVGYWSQHLPNANYYLISLLNSTQLENVSDLNIIPKPNTTIRVMLVIQKLNNPITISAPNITTPERNGFTVVEWGVILRNFSNA